MKEVLDNVWDGLQRKSIKAATSFSRFEQLLYKLFLAVSVYVYMHHNASEIHTKGEASQSSLEEARNKKFLH